MLDGNLSHSASVRYLYLQDILAGVKTKIPVYDFKSNSRTGEFTTIYPSDVVLVEGILVFYYPKLRDMFNMKLFVDTDADSRLARRVLRDIEERGRDLEHVLHQVIYFVAPYFTLSSVHHPGEASI